jgi:hypothetical protein
LAEESGTRSEGTLWINKAYLNSLSAQLQTMLTDVTNQADGAVNPAAYSGTLPKVDQTLNVLAPGGTSGTSSTFAAGANLNAALATMGGSVAEEVAYLKNVLTDMIQEIQTTADAMDNTESLNGDSVTTLMTDLQQTISDINAGPGSGSGSSGSGSSGSGSGGS